MRHSRRFDLTGLKQRWPVFLLAALLALFPAIAVVRTAMVYTFTPAFPDAAARFGPGHPRVIAAKVDRELRTKAGLVSGKTKLAAREALRRAPMLEAPMVLAGIDNLLKNDDRQARRLLTRALVRNPRSEMARLVMLELDLRTNDVRRAGFDIMILGRLLPDAQSVFVPELARMARDPRTTGALAPTLRSDPTMLAGVLRYLAENGADAPLILRLAGGAPVPSPGGDIADWREPLLRAMIARGQFDSAQRLWAAFAGMTEAPGRDAVYDAHFRGLPGLPPFNWAFFASEIGAAEREKSGGLQIAYYGRAAGELAAQLIRLAPGRYRLALRAEGDLHDPQHRLFWNVQCSAKDGALLIALPIANLTYAGRTIAGDFTVPANCPAQWLRLIGEPTEFPKIENVLVREIRIVTLSRQS